MYVSDNPNMVYKSKHTNFKIRFLIVLNIKIIWINVLLKGKHGRGMSTLGKFPCIIYHNILCATTFVAINHDKTFNIIEQARAVL